MTVVFLDRDGVINQKPEAGKYITTWRQFRFLPGSVEAIRSLNEPQVRVIVVTNQRGVALGLMSREELQEVHRRMQEELRSSGAHLDAIFYCPHAENSCDCRKPGVGLFLQAKAEFPDIDLREAWVIGDSDRDMEAGRRLGARLIRIGTTAAPDESSAGSLLEAVTRYVLSGDRKLTA